MGNPLRAALLHCCAARSFRLKHSTALLCGRQAGSLGLPFNACSTLLAFHYCLPAPLVCAALYDWRDSTGRQLDESTGYLLPRAQLLKVAQALPKTVLGACLLSLLGYLLCLLGCLLCLLCCLLKVAQTLPKTVLGALCLPAGLPARLVYLTGLPECLTEWCLLACLPAGLACAVSPP